MIYNFLYPKTLCTYFSTYQYFDISEKNVRHPQVPLLAIFCFFRDRHILRKDVLLGVQTLLLTSVKSTLPWDIQCQMAVQGTLRKLRTLYQIEQKRTQFNALSFYSSKMILDRPNHFGRVPIVLVRSKSFWLGPKHFGQGQIRLFWANFYNLDLTKTNWTRPKLLVHDKYHLNCPK